MASAKKKPEVESSASEERTVVVHLKGSKAYASWLDQASEKTHIPKASIIRLALADWGAKNGLPVPPKI